MPKTPRITEAEWTVMRVIWKKHPITASEVVGALSGTTDWSPKTIKTLITRLANKGVLRYVTEGRTFVFSPTVSEEESLERESETFLTRFFGGSVNPLIAHFIERGKLSQEEVDELRAILRRKGKRS